MKVANISGLEAEAVAAKRRGLPTFPSRGQDLVWRDAALATLLKAGWTHKQLLCAFRRPITARGHLARVVADIRGLAIAYRAAEEDAA